MHVLRSGVWVPGVGGSSMAATLLPAGSSQGRHQEEDPGSWDCRVPRRGVERKLKKPVDGPLGSLAESCALTGGVGGGTTLKAENWPPGAVRLTALGPGGWEVLGDAVATSQPVRVDRAH